MRILCYPDSSQLNLQVLRVGWKIPLENHIALDIIVLFPESTNDFSWLYASWIENREKKIRMVVTWYGVSVTCIDWKYNFLLLS